MFLRIGVGIQIFLMSVFAADGIGTDGIGTISTQLDAAGKLVTADGAGGTAFNLVKYVIVFLGMIIMGTGINDTFIAQDRGGENKKLHGVLKMIGGAMFIGIAGIYGLFK